MGWQLLMNEHVVLQRDQDQIAIVGIENWSAKGRFPKHGKMDKAYQGADQYPFKIFFKELKIYFYVHVLIDNRMN